MVNELFGPTYEIIQIVDRVGGGDSFMGGLIYGLLAIQKISSRRSTSPWQPPASSTPSTVTSTW